MIQILIGNVPAARVSSITRSSILLSTETKKHTVTNIFMKSRHYKRRSLFVIPESILEFITISTVLDFVLVCLKVLQVVSIRIATPAMIMSISEIYIFTKWLMPKVK